VVILKRNFAARGIIIENARPDPDEHVTIDLSVGDRYQLAGRPEWYELGRPYTLRPGNCILIKTRERITLPQDVFGTLCSKGSLSANGLIVSNTKVDPLFGDHLNIPIFNAGRTTLRVHAGMAFCSICFHTLEQRVPLNIHRRAVTQQIPKRRLIDLIASHSEGLISGLIGAVAAILVAIFMPHSVFRSYSPARSEAPPTTPTKNFPNTPAAPTSSPTAATGPSASTVHSPAGQIPAVTTSPRPSPKP